MWVAEERATALQKYGFIGAATSLIGNVVGHNAWQQMVAGSAAAIGANWAGAHEIEKLTAEGHIDTDWMANAENLQDIIQDNYDKLGMNLVNIEDYREQGDTVYDSLDRTTQDAVSAYAKTMLWGDFRDTLTEDLDIENDEARKLYTKFMMDDLDTRGGAPEGRMSMLSIFHDYYSENSLSENADTIMQQYGLKETQIAEDYVQKPYRVFVQDLLDNNQDMTRSGANVLYFSAMVDYDDALVSGSKTFYDAFDHSAAELKAFAQERINEEALEKMAKDLYEQERGATYHDLVTEIHSLPGMTIADAQAIAASHFREHGGKIFDALPENYLDAALGQGQRWADVLESIDTPNLAMPNLAMLNLPSIDLPGIPSFSEMSAPQQYATAAAAGGLTTAATLAARALKGNTYPSTPAPSKPTSLSETQVPTMTIQNTKPDETPSDTRHRYEVMLDDIKEYDLAMAKKEASR